MVTKVGGYIGLPARQLTEVVFCNRLNHALSPNILS
jgi:hypothetical protein